MLKKALVELYQNKTNSEDGNVSAYERIVEVCRHLEGELPGDELKHETREIQELAASLHNFSWGIKHLAESTLRLVDSDLPINSLQTVLNEAVALVGADRGQIFIWVDDLDEFDVIRSPETGFVMNEIEVRAANVIGRVAYECSAPILNPSITAYSEIMKIPGIDGYPDLSIIVVPLTIKMDGVQERIGILYLDVPAGTRIFGDADLWLVQFLGSLTALSIRSIRLTAALRLAYLETVQALIKALEAKDPNTRGHSERVAQYAERCGKRFSLSNTQLKVLYSAALLHDLGKIGIRDNVLNKPAALTSEEYEHVKKHPEISEAILHGLSFLTDENAILKQHHERYDGKGYPQGLKGDEISFEGAIIQVADAWDAMTSRRVYQKELDVEDALKELRSNSGTQFNPLVVDAFIKMIEEDGVLLIGDPGKDYSLDY